MLCSRSGAMARVEIVGKDDGVPAKARLATFMVAYAMDVPAADIMARERGNSDASVARQLAMYLTHTVFGASLHYVAIAFRRDRSTVAHACRVVEDRREDPAFDALVTTLEAVLAVAPAPASAMAGALT
jgi:hypothetical protein